VTTSSQKRELLPGGNFWLDSLPAESRGVRPPLTGDTTVDIAIIGAGYTGLWTAYYLSRLAPDRRILVVEAEYAGFGASGRNGGWCTAEMPALLGKLAARHGPMAAVRLYRAGLRTLAEMRRVLADEGVDCDWREDGSFYVARTEPQRARLLAWHDMRTKLGADGLRLLAEDELRERVRLPGVLAAGFTAQCAAVHPAKLVRGLADVVAARGVQIAEQTRVRDLRPGRLITDHGEVRAGAILCTTEAYTAGLPGHGRRILPVYSHVACTAPLPATVWAELGWPDGDRATLAESRYQFAYVQRTADDRLILGGRGGGYRFGSRSTGRFDRDPGVRRRLRRALAELFPALAGTELTHYWGGVYGLQRDSEPSVVFDPDAGLGYAGGYGGEGIALSNLAARSLAALVLGTGGVPARLCWVNRRSRRWEPEPLRFLGVRGVLGLAAGADAYEDRHDRPAPLATIAMRAVV
jgi:glycine/D-amino acid oxidase-like deaminating enzyme